MATINGDNLPNALLGTETDDIINGNGSNDAILAIGGNDLLNGGTGDDRMIGGIGDDTYFVDSINDKVIENPNQGIDTIITTVNFSLFAAPNVENLTLAGTVLGSVGNELNNVIKGNELDNGLAGNDGNDTLYGFNGDDTLEGGAGNDIIDGGAGNDRMSGSSGDDRYFVDSIGDQIEESANNGTDGVYSTVSYTLGSNLEDIYLEGTANINATGNELNNGLIGNSGNNILDGKAGGDEMFGNLGDDIYVVDEVGDKIGEYDDVGNDTVNASISYTLGEKLENLALTGTANIDGTGNSLNNVLTGNSGNNILDGKAGNDQLVGGLGDDTYIISDASDTIVEAVNGGTDTVNASISYTLGDNLENLILTGAGNLSAIGNLLNNTLKGNAGNNILNGKEGNDTLIGGLGNDIYIVNDAGDQVVENANEGVDVIAASVSYTLSDNVEHLGLTGTANLNATGNALDNVLLGNAGVNSLDGGAGKDSLIGGGGQDRLKGGTEADQFIFTSINDRVDRILDFSRLEGDKVVLVADGFKGLQVGAVKRSQFVLGKKAKDADDRLIYNKKTGALFYDADGKKGVAQVQIAVFGNKPTLGAGDFAVAVSPVPSLF